jgi:putative FmdB family regulatory protein
MPTYEYRREDGTTFEVFQRMSDDPLTVDPETGQKVTRVIGGGTGLIFKGDGFYLTDYARKGKGGSASSPSTSGASSGDGAASSSASDASANEGSASKKPSESSASDNT